MGRQAFLKTARRTLRTMVVNGRLTVAMANDDGRKIKGRSTERKGLCFKPCRVPAKNDVGYVCGKTRQIKCPCRASFTEEK